MIKSCLLGFILSEDPSDAISRLESLDLARVAAQRGTADQGTIKHHYLLEFVSLDTPSGSE